MRDKPRRRSRRLEVAEHRLVERCADADPLHQLRVYLAGIDALEFEHRDARRAARGVGHAKVAPLAMQNALRQRPAQVGHRADVAPLLAVGGLCTHPVAGLQPGPLRHAAGAGRALTGISAAIAAPLHIVAAATTDITNFFI